MYNRVLSDQDIRDLFESGRSFRISQVLVETTGGLQLTWTSSPGVAYVIWSCTDLSSGVWTQEQTVSSAGDSTSWTDPSPGGSSNSSESSPPPVSLVAKAQRHKLLAAESFFVPWCLRGSFLVPLLRIARGLDDIAVLDCRSLPSRSWRD
jgi:hypothetical protein